MKRIVLLLTLAVLATVNVLYITETKQEDITLENLFRLAFANDEEDEIGTCSQNSEELYIETACSNGNISVYSSTSYWCISGFDVSCDTGFKRYSIDCDGVLSETGNVNSMDCHKES